MTIEWSGQQIQVDPEHRILIVDSHGTPMAIMYMPGYDDLIMIAVAQNEGPSWHWNGDRQKPSFTPSILTQTMRGPDLQRVRNHVFVRNGKIQFLNDCSHELAGKTVELPRLEDWPENLRLWG